MRACEGTDGGCRTRPAVRRQGGLPQANSMERVAKAAQRSLRSAGRGAGVEGPTAPPEVRPAPSAVPSQALRRGSVVAAALVLGAVAPLAGCHSQWYHQASHTEIVRTDVIVRATPPGAVVYFNGRRMETAPVRIPVDYEHTVEQWVRQSNASPSWSPTALVTGAKEELKKHVYGGNRHTVSASLDGYEDASRTLVLEGEAEVDVVLELVKSPAR